MNEKDVKDLLMLLVDHDFGLNNKNEIEDLEYVKGVLSNDWGWYTTTTDNLKFLKELSKDYLKGELYDSVNKTIDYMLETFENAPKSLSWKMRSIIGRKVQWYDEPEEVQI